MFGGSVRDVPAASLTNQPPPSQISFAQTLVFAQLKKQARKTNFFFF